MRFNLSSSWLFSLNFRRGIKILNIMDISPFASPLYLLAKPAGARCNLACKYCYYLEKGKLYADRPTEVISEEMLVLFVREFINGRRSRSKSMLAAAG